MLEITVDSETKGNYKVQYSTDGRNYQEYTDRTIPAKMAVCTTDPDIEESLRVLSL